MFNREFHPTDVLILWDTVLANDFEENQQQKEYNEKEIKYNLIMLDYICLAMISYIREERK